MAPGTNPGRFQEIVRAAVALAAVAIFLVTIILAFQSVGASRWENTKELLLILLPAESTLVAAAVGFYLGRKK